MTAPSTVVQYIGLNTTKKPFDNVQVRQARDDQAGDPGPHGRVQAGDHTPAPGEAQQLHGGRAVEPRSIPVGARVTALTLLIGDQSLIVGQALESRLDQAKEQVAQSDFTLAIAQQVASIVNLTRAALVTAAPEKRIELYSAMDSRTAL